MLNAFSANVFKGLLVLVGKQIINQFLVLHKGLSY